MTEARPASLAAEPLQPADPSVPAGTSAMPVAVAASGVAEGSSSDVADAGTAAPVAPSTDVYAIHGADPEVLAYAMAKYSRSALTLRESLSEISAQRAEQFLNTFYFQYGHRSIADLAHIPLAVERLSLLAAIDLVDEQRWDGQERSTRYQDFARSGWYTPDLGPDTRSFTVAIEHLFSAYATVGAGMLEALRQAVPRPGSLKPEAYERILKARAFDVARYLLPLATNTSLGQITNARTLETQISRLLSSPYAEIRALGEQLRSAAASPAWNAQQTASAGLIASLREGADPNAQAAAALLSRPVPTSPTLVKYAAPNPYQIETRAALAEMARELFTETPVAAAPIVDLLDNTEPLEVELAASLLYPVTHHPYRQIRDMVAALPPARRAEIVQLGTAHRSRHDELLRPFHAGNGLRFDILMDIGGFRDMHRHRRCTQLLQPWTDLHGFDEPICPGQPSLAEAGLAEIYSSAMQAAQTSYRSLASSAAVEAQESARYLLPLGMRCRSLFTMDFAEVLYIAELRSTPAGHFSYRRVAWEMFQAVARRHPALASLFRIEDVWQPVDLLRR